MSTNIIVKNRKPLHIFSDIVFNINENVKIELLELGKATHIICCDLDTANKVRENILSLRDRNTEVRYQMCDKELNDLQDKEFYDRLYSDELGGLLIQEEMDRIWIQFEDYQVQEIFISVSAEVAMNVKSPRDLCFVASQVNWMNMFKEYNELWEDREKLVRYIKQMRFFL